jgi:hypothetical protein
MSLPLPRWIARHYRETAAVLPAPGPFPAPPRRTVVIFVIIIVVMTWMLAHDYTVDAALRAIAGAGALTAMIASWLARPQPAAA